MLGKFSENNESFSHIDILTNHYQDLVLDDKMWPLFEIKLHLK